MDFFSLKCRFNTSLNASRPASCWFPAWLILSPWRLRRPDAPKRRLTFKGLHGGISQNTELLISNSPHFQVFCYLKTLYSYRVSSPNSITFVLLWTFRIVCINFISGSLMILFCKILGRDLPQKTWHLYQFHLHKIFSNSFVNIRTSKDENQCLNTLTCWYS
jgi:hypothetical protein